MTQIKIQTEALTNLVSIIVQDDLSHQVLLLMPDELQALTNQLNQHQIEGTNDPARNREAARLRALTLYNGHSLPTIDRPKFEQENQLDQTFQLEIWQNGKKIGTL